MDCTVIVGKSALGGVPRTMTHSLKLRLANLPLNKLLDMFATGQEDLFIRTLQRM
jgi:hypothetical protein